MIFFSSCFLSGCIGMRPKDNVEWILPSKPNTEKVTFVETKRGHYLTKAEATNLVNNVDEYKAYIEKMELLVDEMVDYYDAKTKREEERD